jgi:hypothetical protein
MGVHLPLEHGGTLQHVREDDHDNFTSPQVDLIAFSLHTGFGVGDDSVLDVQVHHVFCLEQQAPDEFTSLRLHLHHRPLGVVQNDDGDPHAVVSHHRHYGVVLLRLLSASLLVAAVGGEGGNRRCKRNKISAVAAGL